MAVDLRFRNAVDYVSPVHLLFNEAYGSNEAVVRVEATIAGPVAAYEGQVFTGPVDLEVSATIAGPIAAVQALLALSTPDYLKAHAGSGGWRDATAGAMNAGSEWSTFAPQVRSSPTAPWRQAASLSDETGTPWRNTLLLIATPPRAPWRDAEALAAPGTRFLWVQMATLHGDTPRVPWRDSVRLEAAGLRAPWREGARLATETRAPWGRGSRATRGVRAPWGLGSRSYGSTALPWQDADGLISWGGPRLPDPPEPPGPGPCYTPSGILVFRETQSGSTELLFVCENNPVTPPATVVVPIRKVYTVINTFTLRRVDTNRFLPATTMAMTLDAQSYTWGFATSLPRSEYDFIKPDADGTPVELEAMVNGVPYRFLIDTIGAERSFGSIPMMRVNGRGLGAALDLLTGSYTNEGVARTAAQIMEDILTINGVGVGWAIDFGLDDWLVPAGVWTHNGTAISALQAVAGAAGGYLQPHPTDKTLRVLPMYPDAPWNWGGITPDYELPVHVVTRESTEWVEKPRYNRVYVTAEQNGIVGVITRQGTAGDVPAPMVTDPLISTIVPATQKGRAVLSDTGRIANIGLRLPVLPATGIIPPGKFVRYVEGDDILTGLSRSVSVEITPTATRQTILIETHV